jgi:hypothetical protein
VEEQKPRMVASAVLVILVNSRCAQWVCLMRPVEDHHLFAEGSDERLEIRLRIDVKVDIQEMSGCGVDFVYNHARS